MAKEKFVCPWWLGYFLVNPLRRLWHNPQTLFASYLRPGMTVLEPGPGMGFFTLDLARLVGAQGKVVALDVQPKMLATLRVRAQKAGVAQSIETRLIEGEAMPLNDLQGKADFALAFAMVHEVPSAARFFAEVAAALRPQGRLFLAEPKGHVNTQAFAEELRLAALAGLDLQRPLSVSHSHAALLAKRA